MKAVKSIWTLIDGHITVFKHLFKRAVTVQYPEKQRDLNKRFRGKLEVKGCIGCGVCQKVCPSGAIKIEKDSSGKVSSYVFDMNKCIFCGNCKYYCPISVIKMTKEFELATENKKELKLKYMGGRK